MLIVTTVIHPVKIHLPAVTVVAAASGLETLEKNCGESEDLRACVEESSPSLSETIHAELGFSLRESLMAPDLWRVDFTGVVPYGQSYTLVYPYLRGNDWLSDDINLHVNTSDHLTRRVLIHDPDYFVLSENPFTLPIKMLTLTPWSGRVYYSLAIREHRKLDTPSNPCVEDPEYSFTTCIKESLSRKTGCRLPWDTLIDQRRQECTTLHQYQAFARKYQKLVHADMSKILTRTGCQKPCRYREYVVAEGPNKSVYKAYSYFSVDLWIPSTDITILTEILVYPWTSLMAEFGGTFSLFFGLSIMTLWDGMGKLANIIKNYQA